MKKRFNFPHLQTQIQAVLLLLNFYKNDSIPHYLLLVGVFVVLRLLLHSLYPTPLQLEVAYMEIGHRLRDGDVLYTDIWTSLSPLSALVYYLLSLLGKQSLGVFRLLAALLCLWHIIRFNIMAMQRRLYNQRHILLGLLASLLLNAHPAFLLLSPELMASSLLLVVFQYNLWQIDEGSRRDYVLEAGFALGIALLFHLPYWWLLLACLFSYFLYTRAGWNQYLPFIFACLLPLLIAVVVFYWINGLEGVFRNWLIAVWKPSNTAFWENETGKYWGISLFVVLLWALTKTQQSSQFLNYQVRIQMMLFWMLLMCLPGWLLGDFRHWGSLYFMILITAFFVSHALLLLRNRWIQAVLFLGMVGWCLSLMFYLPAHDRQRILTHSIQPDIAQQRIWVIGYDYSWYLRNRSQTPFFDYHLSLRYLDQLEHYLTAEQLARQILHNPPHYIIDLKGKWASIAYRLPIVAQHYTHLHDHILQYCPKPHNRQTTIPSSDEPCSPEAATSSNIR